MSFFGDKFEQTKLGLADIIFGKEDGSDQVGFLDVLREVPRSTVDVGKDVLRALPRAGASLTRTAFGKEKEETYVPESKLSKFVFGEEGIDSVQSFQTNMEADINQYGDSTEFEKTYGGAMSGLAFGLFAVSDIFSPGKRSIAKRLVPDTDVNSVTNTLRKEFDGIIDDVEIQKIAQQVADSSDEVEIDNIISRAISMDKMMAKDSSLIGVQDIETPDGARAALAQDPKFREAQRVLTEQKNNRVSDEVFSQAFKESFGAEESLTAYILRKRGKISNEDTVMTGAILNNVDYNKLLSSKTVKILTPEEKVNLALQIRRTQDDIRNLRDVREARPNYTKDELTSIVRKAQNEGIDTSKFVNKDGLTDVSGILDAQILKKELERNKMAILSRADASETGRAQQIQKRVNEISAVDSRMQQIIEKTAGLEPEKRAAVVQKLMNASEESPELFIKEMQDIASISTFQKIDEYATAIKLSAPTTHMKNFVSNTIKFVFKTSTNAITQNPAKTKRELQRTAIGFQQGLQSGLRAWRDESYISNLSGKYDELIANTPAIGGKAGRIIRTPFRALTVVDEIFKGMAYQQHLSRRAFDYASKTGNKKTFNKLYEEFLENPTQTAIDGAKREAARVTFQEEAPRIVQNVGNWRTGYKRVRDAENIFDASGQIVKNSAILTGKLLLPFIKTPFNIAKQGVEMTAGVGLATRYAQRTNKSLSYKQWLKGEEGRTVIAENIVGTGIAVTMFGMISENNLTGAYPEDAKEREAWIAEGRPEHAIRLGGQWIQYRDMEPFGMIARLAVNARNADDVRSVVGGIVSGLSDSIFLEQISKINDAIYGEPWQQDQVVADLLLGAAIPNVVSSFNKNVVDPTLRDARGENFTERFANNFQSRIPGLSQNLPARRGIDGDSQTRDLPVTPFDSLVGNQSTLSNTMNWFFPSIVYNDPVQNDIRKELAILEHPITAPPRKFSSEGEEYELTPRQYSRFAKEIGEIVFSELESLIYSNKYYEMNIDEQIKAVDKIEREAYNKIKEEYIKYEL